jgi:preprotein translocase subunit SecE
MGQNEKVEKAPKTSWFAGLKAEFSKIFWPDRKTLVRQTIAVVAVAVALGLIIALLDHGIQYVIKFVIGLKF